MTSWRARSRTPRSLRIAARASGAGLRDQCPAVQLRRFHRE
ncbi:hypothetical protein ACFQZ4_39865 [Catellatospora coxensis]